MNKKSMWSVKFPVAAFALIPAGIGINYIGKFFAELLKLPLWLDSIGTVLSGMLAGPVIGALVGIINNLIYGFTLSPISYVYAITSGVVGLVAGFMAYKGWISSIKKALFLGLIVGLVAATVSTPLNMQFWGGQTGNIWGDILFAYLSASNAPLWLASFADSIVVDVPDKIVTVLVSYLIFKGLPKNVTQMYDNHSKIERL